ncbi:MAG: biopolymer transporter ExbD [Luteolibacter sp.]
MKLEMTLPERPGLLHAVPVLNLFALLVFFLLLGPSLVLRSGVAVEMPPSRFQMQRYQDALVVTLGPDGPQPYIYLGRDPVKTLEELSVRLKKLRSDGAAAKSIVLLQTDAGTPVGLEREVTELVLGEGFRLAFVGKNAADTKATVPKTEP